MKTSPLNGDVTFKRRKRGVVILENTTQWADSAEAFIAAGYLFERIGLENWNTVETPIIGAGAVVTRFYSIENQPKRYFRVRRN